YPYTSKVSTASVYNLLGWNPSEAKETFKLHNIQCAIGNPGKINDTYKENFEMRELSSHELTLW
ncbi:12804_t:CDS:2, partial [Entrophospora sp. SA101]